MASQQIDLLNSHREEGPALLGRLSDWCASRSGVVNVLEAGCGRQWSLNDLPCSYQLTGVDLDPEALRIRREVTRDLDVAIVGDLRSVQLPPAAYDLIYSAYVLEHIEGADLVLSNFLRWLRPGGVIVLKIPDGQSAYGALTRLTPHWVHVFYYRQILGHAMAGRPGYPPYPTVYESVVSDVGIRNFAAAHGLDVVGAWATRVETAAGVRGGVVRAALRFTELLSGGRFSASHCTLTYLLKLRVPVSSR